MDILPDGKSVLGCSSECRKQIGGRNARSRSGMSEEMMEKERSRLKTIVSAPLLSLAILGCLLLMAGCTSEGVLGDVTSVPTPHVPARHLG